MNDPRMDDLSLTVRRRIGAAPQRVYDAWLQPQTLTRFFGNVPGVSLTRAEVDPRVGGRFRLDIKSGGKEYPHTGTYLELVPHKRIAFTWELHSSTVEGSTVTLDLRPDGEATLLTLTHVRFATEKARDDHAASWVKIIGALAETQI